MHLLDTNHCRRLLQGEPAIRERIVARDTEPVATSVVTIGELMYMAYRSDRLAANLEEVDSLLADLPVFFIDVDVARLFGDPRAALFRRFGPNDRAKQRHTTISQLGFDDNDLWIAAIALQNGLTFVSGDRDFDRIAEISDVKHESWLPPRSQDEPPL